MEILFSREKTDNIFTRILAACTPNSHACTKLTTDTLFLFMNIMM